MDMIELVATQPLMIPAGQLQEGEVFSTTAGHAEQLIGLGLAKKASKKAVAEAKKSD